MAEKRFVRQLVGVLRIEHDHVVARQRKAAEPHFQVIDRHDHVARHVEHDAERLERRALFAFDFCKRGADAARSAGDRVVFKEHFARGTGHAGDGSVSLDPLRLELQPAAEAGNRIFLLECRQKCVQFFRHVRGTPHQSRNLSHNSSSIVDRRLPCRTGCRPLPAAVPLRYHAIRRMQMEKNANGMDKKTPVTEWTKTE